MAAIQDLFSKIEKLTQEVRKLKGRLDGISVGTTIIHPSPGTVLMPTATLGSIPVGNSTPAWERLPPPTPGPSEEWELTFYDGDTQPVWRLKTGISSGKYRQFVYEVSGGTFTFVTDLAGNPIFALEDLE